MKKIKNKTKSIKALALTHTPTEKDIESMYDVFLGQYIAYLMCDIVERKSVNKKINKLTQRTLEVISNVKTVVEHDTKNLNGVVKWYVKDGVICYE